MNVAASTFAERRHSNLSQQAALVLVSGNMAAFDDYPESDHYVPDVLMSEIWDMPHLPTLSGEACDKILPDKLAVPRAAVGHAVEGGYNDEAAFRLRHTVGKILWIAACGLSSMTLMAGQSAL